MAFGGFNNGEKDKKKKKIAIIGVSSLILVAMVVAVIVGVSNSGNSSTTNNAPAGEETLSSSEKAIKAICQPTDYRDTCEQSLLTAAGNTTDPKELVKAGFKVAISELKAAIRNSTSLQELAKEPRTNQALQNCHELIQYAIDDLNQSFARIGTFEIAKMEEYITDLKVWLSAALTYEQTCLDGFENTTGNAGEQMKNVLTKSQQLTSNGLAMVTEISSILSSFQIPTISRRLMSENSSEEPSWVDDGKRLLLQATPATVKADVVVAKDGSGKYKTVNEALKEIPKKNSKTFVIYVKAGVYKENVMIDKSMTYVMLIGDGPTKTKITGNENFVDGTPTFKTATVAVIGNNFIAKNIGFENSAGAAKHQAVALRVQSDMSIFYNCQMDGYQDTLYTHANRQFYRDCTISGTIDFIFGNGAVVLQNCKMIVRKPLENQQCIVTAQGRLDRREPTGLVLQNCTITSDPAYYPFRNQNRAYLGRPWKEYSRTIIMQSQIDDLIQPEGWLPWMGDFALKTCFYTEVDNRGAGSVQTKRVKWRGIKKISSEHAVKFTAERFLHGNLWIKPTGVPYSPGMITL